MKVAHFYFKGRDFHVIDDEGKAHVYKNTSITSITETTEEEGEENPLSFQAQFEFEPLGFRTISGELEEEEALKRINYLKSLAKKGNTISIGLDSLIPLRNFGLSFVYNPKTGKLILRLPDKTKIRALLK